MRRPSLSRPSASPAPARIPAGCGCRYRVGQPSPYGVAAPCGSTSGRCCQGCGANRRALAVMLGEFAGGAGSADELAIDEERQASFDGYCAFERENADADAAFLEHVLERLRRPLVKRGGAGLADGDVRAAVLRRVRLLEVDEGAGRIYDRDRHEPFVLARFRRDSRRDFLRGIQADARPDKNGVGAGRRRRSSLGEGRSGADDSRHDEADGDRSLQHGRPPCERRHTARIAHRAQGGHRRKQPWKTASCRLPKLDPGRLSASASTDARSYASARAMWRTRPSALQSNQIEFWMSRWSRRYARRT